VARPLAIAPRQPAGLTRYHRPAARPRAAAAAHRPRHRKAGPMCRSIKTLHNLAPPATDDEIAAAARQFVRKLSGSQVPSRANAAAFEQAVADVAAAARTLLDALVTTAPARDRAAEAAKARAAAARRFGARAD